MRCCSGLQGLVLVLLPAEYCDTLPAATALACAPHWLEAAGWLVALLSDATAAAMGRLPAAQRPEHPRSLLGETASTGMEQGLMRLRPMPFLCTMPPFYNVPTLFQGCRQFIEYSPSVSLDLLHPADGSGGVTG